MSAASGRYPSVLTIAGSDSGGGAGIQADLKTCTALRVYGTSVLTALTAQNSIGVQRVEAVSTSMIDAQLSSVLSDFPPSAVKTGMLPSASVVDTVHTQLQRMSSRVPLVVDPVLVATSGDSLAGSGVATAMSDKLFALATVVTPNATEAAALTGRAGIDSDAEARAACVHLVERTQCKAVLLKGGHRISSKDEAVVDLLFDARTKEFNAFSAPRVDTKNTHGTGCSLASAIACFLARGDELPDAVRGAKHFVHTGLRQGSDLDLGHAGNGPLFHMHTVREFAG